MRSGSFEKFHLVNNELLSFARVSKHWCKNGASRQSLLAQKHSNHLGSAPIPPRTHQTKFSVGVFTMASARPASSPKKKFTSHALSENWASVVADQYMAGCTLVKRWPTGKSGFPRGLLGSIKLANSWTVGSLQP